MNTIPKEIIVVIPARGGSKGIPGKNIRSVGGKPLLAWSIEQARQTPQVIRVFVSTDSAKIATVARNYGAEVIMRPPEISGDTASSESCLVHALEWVQSAKRQAPSAKGDDQGSPPASRFPLPASSSATDLQPLTSDPCQPDLVVFLQATSPLREPDDIQRAIETLEREAADSLFSACRAEGFTWRVEKDGTPRSFTYDHQDRPRRQDAPEDLIENGSIYIFKPWVLRQFNNRLGGKIAVYRMPALHSFQIDEPADLELVEALIAVRQRATGMRDYGLRASRQRSEGVDQKSVVSSQSSVISNPLSVVGCEPSSVRSQSSVVSSQWLAIRLLVLDFDGVLTDNRVLVDQDGTEAVICDRGDGLGLERLRGKGIEVIVISKEKNPVVAARCRKLGIECIQGQEEKLLALMQKARNVTADHGPRTADRPGATKIGGLKPEQIAYVGNDVNDLECLRWVGLPIAVCDAMPEVLAIAKWITTKPGGHGAVREVCDLLLESIASGQ